MFSRPAGSSEDDSGTIIAAPSSTKNMDGERDPEMHQARKSKDDHYEVIEGWPLRPPPEDPQLCLF